MSLFHSSNATTVDEQLEISYSPILAVSIYLELEIEFYVN